MNEAIEREAIEPIEIEPADIERQFPRWGVWVSDSGTWWATFQGPWKLDRERHGCMPHWHAESAEKLKELLEEHDGCLECWGRDVAVAA